MVTARRPMGRRGNRRLWRVRTGVAFTALDYLISTPLQYVRGDVADITESSSRVSAWVDKTGNYDLSQGTGANQPLWLPAGGPGGKGAVHTDSSVRWMGSSLNTPAPATTPTLVYMVVSAVSNLAAHRVTSANSGGQFIYQSGAGAAPWRMVSAVAGDNYFSALDTWVRVAAWFDGAATDFIQVGSTKWTPANAGSAAGTGMGIGDVQQAVGSANIKFAEVLYCDPATASAADADIAALDSYLDAYYGVGVVST